MRLLLAISACLGAVACGSPAWTGPDTPAVLQFASSDARNWRLLPEPAAVGLVSLGWGRGPDGEVRVTGVVPHRAEHPWSRRLLGEPVAGLRWEDGAWARATWRVRAGEDVALLDPQWHGDRLWYMAAEGRGGDPVGPDRRNAIAVSPGGTRVLEGRGLADPAPVDFAGERFLFVTAWPTRVAQFRLPPDGGSPELLREWAGLSVPFATVVDGELWLLAQATVQGRRLPVVARSDDGRDWSAFTLMVPWTASRACTSPVMGEVEDGEWRLLCVDEQPAPARQGEGPPVGAPVAGGGGPATGRTP